MFALLIDEPEEEVKLLDSYEAAVRIALLYYKWLDPDLESTITIVEV